MQGVCIRTQNKLDDRGRITTGKVENLHVANKCFAEHYRSKKMTGKNEAHSPKEPRAEKRT